MSRPENGEEDEDAKISLRTFKVIIIGNILSYNWLEQTYMCKYTSIYYVHCTLFTVQACTAGGIWNEFKERSCCFSTFQKTRCINQLNII